MTKKVFFSKTWLIAGVLFFLSTACQPKAMTPSEPDYPKPPKPNVATTPQQDTGCKGDSCKAPCATECPKKECPCPADCSKPECKKECPCPKEPPKECPCDKNCDKGSCELEPKKSEPAPVVTQSPVQVEAATEKSVESSITQNPSHTEAAAETPAS